MSEEQKTLYERLGGYDAIAAVANDLLPRLRSAPQLGRFWKNRAEDSIMREKQLLIDFLCANAGGPMYYRGHAVVASRDGYQRKRLERLSRSCGSNAGEVQVPEAEQRDVVAFVESLKKDIVE